MTTEQEKVSEERGKSYGDFGKMAIVAQKLKFIAVTKDMTSVQRESMELICTKIARLVNGDPCHRDSWFDIGAYAMLVVNNMDKEGQ